MEELQAEQMRCYATAALLLHSGQIDPDEKNSAGRRAFDLAMEGGAQWVSALLSGEDPFDELTMETGGMDLFQALRKKDRKALEALLRAGVDPDAECDDREMNDWVGKTPLVCALEWGRGRNRGNAAPRRSRSRPTDLEGHLSIYRLDRTRMPLFQTGWSALHRLWSYSNSGDGTPMPHRRGRTNGPSCWHASTTTTKLAIWALRRLLKRKVEVNSRDALGRTALMHLLGPRSAGPYQPEMLERLLEAGADPCAADNVGRTVLHYAAEGYTHAAARQAAEMLFDFGRPDISAADKRRAYAA